METNTGLEELVADLSSFGVSKEENCASNRIEYYKSKSSKQDQESRRAAFLERQKNERQQKLDLFRNIEASAQDSAEKSNPFRNKLMLSEWLAHEPTDFADNWLYKFAPVGHRTLLVAQRGKTCSYTKNGYRTATFSSHLPGGNRTSKASSTIVDGIWSDADNSFYILDVISFKSHPVTDSEAEFRFYWGGTKFTEDVPLISTICKNNHYPMLWLPHFPCSRDGLSEGLSMLQHLDFKVDGVLFYHKMGHYVAGSTPLVGWLKPHMLNSLNNVDPLLLVGVEEKEEELM